MQTIYLKKFGTVLVSRPAGLEAFNAIRSSLLQAEDVQVDCADVLTVTPSWLDEFLTQLAGYMHGNVVLLPAGNVSVLSALPVLAEQRDDRVAEIVKRAIGDVKDYPQ